MLLSPSSSIASPSGSTPGSRYPIRKSRLRRPPKKPIPTHVLWPSLSTSSRTLSTNPSTMMMMTSSSTTNPANIKYVTAFWLSAACCLLLISIVPIYILESLDDPSHPPLRTVHSVHGVFDMAKEQIRKRAILIGIRARIDNLYNNNKTSNNNNTPKQSEQQQPQIQQPQIRPDLPTARLLPKLLDTPALIGAKRATLKCPSIDERTVSEYPSLVYWNDPVGTRDLQFVSPFVDQSHGFISFTPDAGGWNNIRMSMEVLFVLALVTGRTLVLPPKAPFYLLSQGASRQRGFADFFPLHHPNFPVKLMSMEDFLNTTIHRNQLKAQNNSQAILNSAKICEYRVGSKFHCDPIYQYLIKVGHNPNITAMSSCLLFDQDAFAGRNPSPMAMEIAKTYCGPRNRVFWNLRDHARHPHLHFPAHDNQYRLLTHFYNLMHFSDPLIENYVKRFVRDYLHYNDIIYCAAAKIVRQLQVEGMQRGFPLDANGGGGYSAMHVRRGDLQYKVVKISAQEWYNNTREIWLDREILYIATDERNKTFFDDLAKHYDLRFLENYWDLAGLAKVDPNYMGMIDTIVASRARAFAGTWFSTFSGYINRLRGYYGMSMKDSWYSWKARKTALHQWRNISTFAYAFEWPDGWVGIDGDTWPSRDVF